MSPLFQSSLSKSFKCSADGNPGVYVSVSHSLVGSPCESVPVLSNLRFYAANTMRSWVFYEFKRDRLSKLQTQWQFEASPNYLTGKSWRFNAPTHNTLSMHFCVQFWICILKGKPHSCINETATCTGRSLYFYRLSLMWLTSGCAWWIFIKH